MYSENVHYENGAMVYFKRTYFTQNRFKTECGNIEITKEYIFSFVVFYLIQ